jgi:hypothetical protein
MCCKKPQNVGEDVNSGGVSKHERIRGMPNEQEKDHRTTQD